MSERYTRIFSLTENLYAEGSPVIISAGALLKDNETGKLLAQLKLHSLSQKTIKLAKVELVCYDSVGRELDTTVSHEYLDLAAERGSDFGAKTPISVPNSATRSYSVKVAEIGFSDNTVWTPASDTWEPIPKQEYISKVLENKNALIGYTAKFGDSARYALLEHKDLVICTCGTINRSENECCYKCGAFYQKLKELDAEALAADGIRIETDKTYAKSLELFEQNTEASLTEAIKLLDTISDYEKVSELKEKCENNLHDLREAKAVSAKKRKKALKISGLVFGILVVLGLLAYFAVYPLASYLNGDYSVYIQMYNVKEFEVPEGTEQLINSAFSNCDSLEKVTIPDSVTSIGNNVFYYCVNLTSVTIPNSVTSIGDSAFGACHSLTSITIPESITVIENWAFSNCHSLKSVTIPKDVKSIGSGAFYGCESFEQISIPDGVTAIGSYAFSNCANLAEITIPASVVSIGEDALYKCDSLERITLPIAWTTDSSGSITTILGYNLPENLTTIITTSGTSTGKYAFSDEQFTSITLHEGLESIDDSAFKNCEGLTSITIPSTVKHIGENAFEDCTNLKNIIIPNGVTTIGKNAFYNCTKLESVTIPSSVTVIEDYAFYNCKNIKSISIPAGIKTIGKNAFGNCTALTGIILGETLESIGNYAFEGCSSITEIIIPNSVTSIGRGALRGCDKLVNISLPYVGASIKGTGDKLFAYIFAGSSAYESEDIPGSIRKVSITGSSKIGSYAFYQCRYLTEIVISDSITSIDSYAFRYCYDLKTVTIGSSVKNIGLYAFSSCSDLTNVTFVNPNGWKVKYYWSSSSATSLSASNLSNTSTAATYLQSQYDDYDWTRS